MTTEQFIDEYLQHILQRPLMYATSLETLEAILWVLLAVRTQATGGFDGWRTLREVADEWYLGNSSLAHAITKQYGTEVYDPNHPRYEDVMGLYKKWVDRCLGKCLGGVPEPDPWGNDLQE